MTSPIADIAVGGIGHIIKGIGDIADDLITTDEELAKAELDQYEAETKRLESQTQINVIEAGNSNLFVSGWRPAIGWLCGFAFAYSAILEPLMRFVSSVMYGYIGGFPLIDTTLTMQILFGILGLGAMRSYDKKNGASK